jgi:FAD/FMN-containing dehydrogenase
LHGRFANLCSSSGPNSLSIWTHNIRGIEVNKGDPRAVALGGIASVKISAGMQMFEIYTEAAKNNITVVGGGDMDVGIGGWISGAGHSPISSKFGLGTDQVLEMEVVTADGELRTINPTADADLFWAMRGVSCQLPLPRLSLIR